MSEEAGEKELRALMLPLQHGSIVVPHAVVAEIISYREPEESAEFEELDWVLGTTSWQGMIVPVASIELLHGGTLDTLSPKTKIAICNLLDSSLPYPAIGIVVQTIPRILLLSSDQIETPELETDQVPLAVTMEAIYKGDRLWIPDLEWLGEQLPALG